MSRSVTLRVRRAIWPMCIRPGCHIHGSADRLTDRWRRATMNPDTSPEVTGGL
jgi:hypothetical protein